MRYKAVFLDRDGTIARDVHYCRRVEDFEILPGVPEAIRLLNQNGFKVVVITNQSGIARGYFTEETLAQIHQVMKAKLAEHGARVDAIYYCPHHPDEGCECRKPKPKLILQAAEEMGLSLEASCMVGDMQQDMKAGRAAGCKTALVTTGPNAVPELGLDGLVDYVGSSLIEVAEWIVKDGSHAIESNVLEAQARHKDSDSAEERRIRPKGERKMLSVIIPAYNEAQNLERTVEETLSTLAKTDLKHEVIIVDDGSRDGTYEKALAIASKRPNVKASGYNKNMGKGYALKRGFQFARGDLILFLDADSDLPSSQIPVLLDYLSQDSANIIVGSKRHRLSKVHYPLLRKVLSAGYHRLVRTLLNLNVSDTQVGIKLFQREVLEQVLAQVSVKRYAFDVELLATAARSGYRINEAPVTLEFRNSSKIDLRAVWRMFLDTLRVFYRIRIRHLMRTDMRDITWVRVQGQGPVGKA
jgi:dolichol-phosphate mannosyltransferase